VGRLIPDVETGSTPDRIARAAVGLFVERGFQATSVDDIAAAAGLTKPTFYYHFPSKLGLLHALLDASLTRIEQALHAANRPELAPPVRLRNLLRAYALEVSDRPELWTIYFSERKVIDPGVMDGWRERERKMVSVVERTIGEGIDAGVFHAGDPFVLAMGAMGPAGWLHHWFRRDGAVSADEVADTIAGMVCEGLAAVPAPERDTIAGHRGRAEGRT
jgi:AcrR family transcriptional regulator